MAPKLRKTKIRKRRFLLSSEVNSVDVKWFKDEFSRLFGRECLIWEAPGLPGTVVAYIRRPEDESIAFMSNSFEGNPANNPDGFRPYMIRSVEDLKPFLESDDIRPLDALFFEEWLKLGLKEALFSAPLANGFDHDGLYSDADAHERFLISVGVPLDQIKQWKCPCGHERCEARVLYGRRADGKIIFCANRWDDDNSDTSAAGIDLAEDFDEFMKIHPLSDNERAMYTYWFKHGLKEVLLKARA